MPPSRSRAWSFWWVCQHCDALRNFLVNECPDQEVVWARCSRCSSLLVVGDDHRAEAERQARAMNEG